MLPRRLIMVNNNAGGRHLQLLPFLHTKHGLTHLSQMMMKRRQWMIEPDAALVCCCGCGAIDANIINDEANIICYDRRRRPSMILADAMTSCSCLNNMNDMDHDDVHRCHIVRCQQIIQRRSRRRRKSTSTTKLFATAFWTAMVLSLVAELSDAFSLNHHKLYTARPTISAALTPSQSAAGQSSLLKMARKRIVLYATHDYKQQSLSTTSTTVGSNRVNQTNASAAAAAVETPKKKKKKTMAASSSSSSSTGDGKKLSQKKTKAVENNNKSTTFIKASKSSSSSSSSTTSTTTSIKSNIISTDGTTLDEEPSEIIQKSTTTPNRISLRLQSLLIDDTGEQEMELFPDSSPEAAAQVADLKSYIKVNDEARRKANVAVKEDGGNDDDEEDHDGGNNQTRGRGKFNDRRHHDDGASQSTNNNLDNRVTLSSSSSTSSTSSQKRRSSIRATVKETGSDSISTYIKSLGQHELLYKEDEMLLGRQVRLLSKLEEKRHELELQLLHPPTFAQWANATQHTVPSLKQQIRRSQRAKAALIEGNLRLVITVARQAVKKSQSAVQGHGSDGSTANTVQFQDACQSGIIGLTRATEKFDPDRGFRFSTYATWWIRKEVSRNVSEQSRSVRIPPSAIKIINDIYIQERVLMTELGRRPRDEELACRVNMSVQKLNFYRTSAKEVKSLDKKIDSRTGKGSMSTGSSNSDGATMDIFVKDTEHASPTDLVNEAMLKDEIRRLVGTLSPREQAVIRLRFGLDEGSEPLGLNDIATKFCVEKEQIRKIEARALLKLRQPSRSQVIKCYVSDHT